MTTIRVEKRHRYTAIDRQALNDKRLSYRARGILAYLLDKPDDWRTNAGAIAAAGREGREAVRTALRELEACGYLDRKQWRNRTGRWESEWTVLERPLAADSSALPDSTQPGNPTRVTGSGYPTRFPGPQVLNTETEDGPCERLFDSGPVPPPWRERGMTYAEWVERAESETA